MNLDCRESEALQGWYSAKKRKRPSLYFFFEKMIQTITTIKYGGHDLDYSLLMSDPKDEK